MSGDITLESGWEWNPCSPAETRVLRAWTPSCQQVQGTAWVLIPPPNAPTPSQVRGHSTVNSSIRVKGMNAVKSTPVVCVRNEQSPVSVSSTFHWNSFECMQFYSKSFKWDIRDSQENICSSELAGNFLQMTLRHDCTISISTHRDF